jgi:hypothetical protein
MVEPAINDKNTNCNQSHKSYRKCHSENGSTWTLNISEVGSEERQNLRSAPDLIHVHVDHAVKSWWVSLKKIIYDNNEYINNVFY